MRSSDVSKRPQHHIPATIINCHSGRKNQTGCHACERTCSTDPRASRIAHSIFFLPLFSSSDSCCSVSPGINGLLYTGGGLSLDADSLFFQQALYLFNKARAANDAGDVFPIWGSCQGFQMMHLLAAQPANHESILKCNVYDTSNIGMKLDFTSEAPGSYMFGPAQYIPSNWNGSSMHPTIYEALATTNITINLHNCGVNPKDFAADPILPTFYNILSTNVAPNGLPFVSSIEAKKYPFGATQWHAERPQYEWNPTEDLTHSGASMVVHGYMSQRLVAHARMSTNKLPTVADEIKSLIYNYPPTFSQYRLYYDLKVRNSSSSSSSSSG